MKPESKIYVAGHRGLVGSAIARRLRVGGYRNIVTRTHAELDLSNQAAVLEFFRAERPEYVFLAAAKVGGIYANDAYPADFIFQNLAIQTNVIHSAYETGVKKLLFLGSSCIYPKFAPQPMTEECLLTGTLEPTNEPYAVAKIAGIKMCAAFNRQYGTNFLSVMPTNLYGPGDNYHSVNSHVIPALIRRFHEAKMQGAEKVVVWGSGTPRREFLHVDDMAEACVFIMERVDRVFDPELGLSLNHINIGAGADITIRKLAELIARVVGYVGRIEYDPSKPDGPERKLLDVNRIHRLGWRAKISLEDGMHRTYIDFQKTA